MVKDLSESEKVDFVAKTLFRDWDPIGVSKQKGPGNEYRKYAVEIVSNPHLSQNFDSLSDYLDRVVTISMRLDPDKTTNKMVARQILEYLACDLLPKESAPIG